MNRLSLELPAVNFSGEFSSFYCHKSMTERWFCDIAAPPWPSLTRVTPTFSPRRLKWCHEWPCASASLPETSKMRWVWEPRFHVKHANSVSSWIPSHVGFMFLYTQQQSSGRSEEPEWKKVLEFFRINNFYLFLWYHDKRCLPFSDELVLVCRRSKSLVRRRLGQLNLKVVQDGKSI